MVKIVVITIKITIFITLPLNISIDDIKETVGGIKNIGRYNKRLFAPSSIESNLNIFLSKSKNKINIPKTDPGIGKDIKLEITSPIYVIKKIIKY
jgi:hypothetical protein